MMATFNPDSDIDSYFIFHDKKIANNLKNNDQILIKFYAVIFCRWNKVL